MTYNSVSYLTDLSDDILLHIFSFLSSWDLINLLDTCCRLNKVARDHSLWKVADFSEQSLSYGDIKRRVLQCLQSATKQLLIKGRKGRGYTQHKWKSDLLTPTLLRKIGEKCPHLEKFYMRESVMNAKKIKLIDFGVMEHLKEFSLVGCELINVPSPISEGSYFKNMQKLLPRLHTLEVSNNSWISDYDLMVLSKMDSIKKLVMKSNIRIGFTIAYLAISFRFGFKNVEELDMRGTSLENRDVHCMLYGGESGKLRSLSIGPIGRVRRLNELAHSYMDGPNMMMSDPQRKDEPIQQVVVIKMGPDGPNWRQASDEDLDKMGLQWVKKGAQALTKPPSEDNDEEENHYFIGKEGKLLSSDNSSSSGENSSASTAVDTSRKRSLDEEEGETSTADDDNESDQPKCKRRRKTIKSPNHHHPGNEMWGEVMVDTPNRIPSPMVDGHALPDEKLSDLMIPAFREKGNSLHTLRVSGCAITDTGVSELCLHTPSLKLLDISHTQVTPAGVEIIQSILPHCQIILEENDVETK